MNALFLSYTGLLEPLGRSQVLPYVLGLAQRGHEMSVVSFERAPSDAEVERLDGQLAQVGVRWFPMLYHKWPPVVSTAYDVLRGCWALRRAVKSSGVRLVHARSHVPALVAEILRVLTGLPYIFDHRGLMAEEYADARMWTRGGLLYNATNSLEARFIAKAMGVVVLTQRLEAELRACRRSVVIPCAVDLSRFRPGDLGREVEFDLVYAGSWNGLYEASTIIGFYEAYRKLRPGARLLLLIAKASAPLALPEGVEVRHPEPAEVPDLLRRARAGLSFRRVGRAAIAASPVKVSEYLASGLPVVTNQGVGDLDGQLATHRAGVVVKDVGPDGLERAAAALQSLVADPGTPDRCRSLASAQFDLDVAVSRYDALYREVESEEIPPPAPVPGQRLSSGS